jgi:hypothetical protein
MFKQAVVVFHTQASGLKMFVVQKLNKNKSQNCWTEIRVQSVIAAR